MKKLGTLILGAILTIGISAGISFKPSTDVAMAGEVNEKTYTMSSYSAGTQYAENEEHVLDDNLTITTTQCHFTTELRIYSSSSHDGFAILKANNNSITGLSFNAGKNADTLNVYGSSDNSNWTLIEGVNVSSSYSDYSVSKSFDYQYIKLDVDGSNQVRVKSITVTYKNAIAVQGPEEMTIPEALESADGLAVSVRGIVSEINTPYSSSYNNISLTITDGENDLYIFRLTGEYEVGDDITVTGTMATYQGKRQIAQGATAVLHSSGNEIPGYVAPVEVSIFEALEASDDTWVIVTGMVSNIGTAWDDTNGRISVTITDGNDELYIYRLYTKVALYDYITITGKMGTYKDNRQLAEGSTAVIATATSTNVASRIKILAGGWDNEVTTENCYNNYAAANELVLALSAEEKETFKTSTDTEIASARKTYEHWCFVNGAEAYEETVPAGSRLSAFNNSNNMIIIVVAISSLVILATAGLLISRKRRYSK